jgi:hypothetical protein
MWLLAVALGANLIAMSALRAAEPDMPAALLERAQVAAPRCPQCGWIESKRLVLPGTYEYTVRMSDGSSSVFLQALPATWRVRERLIVID